MRSASGFLVFRCWAANPAGRLARSAMPWKRRFARALSMSALVPACDIPLARACSAWDPASAGHRLQGFSHKGARPGPRLQTGHRLGQRNVGPPPFAEKRRVCFLALLAYSSRSHADSAHLSSGGLRFEVGPHAARISRSVLNVPFQRSIRALMLLHAACRARWCLSGESATRPSSSSRPIGP